VIAALAATAGLHAFDAVEQKLLGGRPVYHQARMARRLFGTAAPAPAMRWAYGVTVGILAEHLEPSPLWFGPAIALFELAVLPAVGATPPVRRWPRGQVVLLFAHATAFALLVRVARRWKSARATAAG
jgi:hypothetical protein